MKKPRRWDDKLKTLAQIVALVGIWERTEDGRAAKLDRELEYELKKRVVKGVWS